MCLWPLLLLIYRYFLGGLILFSINGPYLQFQIDIFYKNVHRGEFLLSAEGSITLQTAVDQVLLASGSKVVLSTLLYSAPELTALEQQIKISHTARCQFLSPLSISVSQFCSYVILRQESVCKSLQSAMLLSSVSVYNDSAKIKCSDLNAMYLQDLRSLKKHRIQFHQEGLRRY